MTNLLGFVEQTEVETRASEQKIDEPGPGPPRGRLIRENSLAFRNRLSAAQPHEIGLVGLGMAGLLSYSRFFHAPAHEACTPTRVRTRRRLL